MEKIPCGPLHREAARMNSAARKIFSRTFLLCRSAQLKDSTEARTNTLMVISITLLVNDQKTTGEMKNRSSGSEAVVSDSSEPPKTDFHVRRISQKLSASSTRQ